MPRTRRWPLLALAAILAAGGFGGPAVGSQPRPSQPEADLAILRDPAAQPQAKSAAAQRLVFDAGGGGAKDAVLAAIADTENGAQIALAIAAELPAIPWAPAWLLEPMARLAADGASADRQRQAIAAIGSIRTREAVRTLLDLTAANQPAPVRSAAFASLGRLTGRGTPLGQDRAAWTEWFASVEFLPEADWRRVLAEGLAGRGDRKAADADKLQQRLRAELRQRFVDAQTAEQRARLLTTWLADELPEVRRLALTLIDREVANARIPGQPVIDAVLVLLRDPSPEFRVLAAELLPKLTPNAAAGPIAAALAQETSPEAAGSLLRVAARWPSPAVGPAAIAWLKTGPPTLDAAAEAILALDASNQLVLDDPAEMLAALRSRPAGDLPRAALRLLARFGSAEDRATISALLDDPAARARAADALADCAECAPALVRAAEADPSLFIYAGRAAAANSPTLATYRRLAAIPVEDGAARRTALAGVAHALPTSSAFAAAVETTDLQLREAILTPFADRPVLPLISPVWGSARRLSEPDRVAGILLLARARIELGRPDQAIAALGRLDPVAHLITGDYVTSLRLAALLHAGRGEEAVAVRATPAQWLAAMEGIQALPTAQAALAAFDRAFPDGVAEPLQGRLAHVRGRLEPTVEPPQ